MTNASELFDPDGEISELMEGFTPEQREEVLWEAGQAAHFAASKVRARVARHQPWCQRHIDEDTCATLPYSYHRDMRDDEPFVAYLQRSTGQPSIVLEECGMGEYDVDRIERLAQHLLRLVEMARGGERP